MPALLEELKFRPSLVVAATSGFVSSLAAPPNGWLWASWIGLVPLLLVVRRAGVSGRQAAALGVVGGMGVGLGGFPWIGETIVRFSGVSEFVGFVGLLLFSLWMALPYGIWAVGQRLGPRDGWRGYVWPIALFVALQASWPQLFPYSFILGFAERPEWIQAAELAGVHLVEAIVVLTSLLITDAVRASEMAPRLRKGAIAAAIPVVLFVAGDLRMRALDAEADGARTLRVGVIQPNAPVGLPAEAMLERLTTSSARASMKGAELILWPESGTYPYRITRPFEHDRELGDNRVLRRHRLETLFGASTRFEGDRFGYNSVYHLAADGAVLGLYDKVKLVPMGEAIPLVDPDWVTERIPKIAHHHAGEEVGLFVVRAGGGDREVRLGPLICYEDIIPAFVRRVAAQEGGVDLLVNFTNDAWFGPEKAPWEHLALAQMRSVEHRIPLVRSVSAGVSAVVDYNGRLTRHIPSRPVMADPLDENPPEILVEWIRLPRNTAERPTPYARLGWLFPHVCQVGVVVAICVFWLRRPARAYRL